MEQKTPLYDAHVRHGGRIVPFAGWLLPVQYGAGILAEHMSVRGSAGLFDVSHMGELMLTGSGATATLQRLVTNDCARMYDGQVKYSPMCNDWGGVVDDLLIHRLRENQYLLVVNAANREKDADWIRARLLPATSFEDLSDSYAQLALQGPRSFEILSALTAEADIPAKYYTFHAEASVAGARCLLARTGYTGEDGFELYCAPQDAEALWEALLLAGAPAGLIPCGLGARDTLRLEASMPLYGHEMNEDITPLEAGLSMFVKTEKEGGFIGRDAMLSAPARRRVGLKILGRGIVREHCPVYSEGTEIGFTTSGTHCPYLNGAYAMALVDAACAKQGMPVLAEVRGRTLEAEIVRLPFYKRKP